MYALGVAGVLHVPENVLCVCMHYLLLVCLWSMPDFQLLILPNSKTPLHSYSWDSGLVPSELGLPSARFGLLPTESSESCSSSIRVKMPNLGYLCTEW